MSPQHRLWINGPRQGPGRGGSKARALGRRARRGQEPQIRLAVDVIYPTWLLLDCLKAFADEQPDTRIELYETVLGGTDERTRQTCEQYHA